jgi:hypothetical protein
MDLIGIPELSFFPFGAILRKKVVGRIHLFPAFQFGGDLILMRICKPSSAFFRHFSSPFLNGSRLYENLLNRQLNGNQEHFSGGSLKDWVEILMRTPQT